jgi:hypothetical protein
VLALLELLELLVLPELLAEEGVVSYAPLQPEKLSSMAAAKARRITFFIFIITSLTG